MKEIPEQADLVPSVLELHHLLAMLWSNPLELVQYSQVEKVHISLWLQLLKGG
jgi:hypothetical protein